MAIMDVPQNVDSTYQSLLQVSKEKKEKH